MWDKHDPKFNKKRNTFSAKFLISAQNAHLLLSRHLKGSPRYLQDGPKRGSKALQEGCRSVLDKHCVKIWILKDVLNEITTFASPDHPKTESNSCETRPKDLPKEVLNKNLSRSRHPDRVGLSKHLPHAPKTLQDVPKKARRGTKTGPWPAQNLHEASKYCQGGFKFRTFAHSLFELRAMARDVLESH